MTQTHSPDGATVDRVDVDVNVDNGRAGLSIVPVVPWEGAPADQLPNFYHAVLNFEHVQCTL